MSSIYLFPRVQQGGCETFADADAEADEIDDDDDASDEEIEFDWQIEQEPFIASELSLDGPKYGFANQRCAILQRLQVSQYAC